MRLPWIARAAAGGALAAVGSCAAACGAPEPAAPVDERPAARPLVASPAVSVEAAVVASSRSVDALPWPPRAELPLSTTQLPRGFLGVRIVRSDSDRRDLVRAVCGSVDPEDFALEAIPEERVKAMARALAVGEATSEVLRCRQAFIAALGPDLRSTTAVISETSSASHERVGFVRLPMTTLPETARFVHDAAALLGLEEGRCQYSEMRPEEACTELSTAVARWSSDGDGKEAWWVFGRVTGLRALVAARGGTHAHPRIEELRALLPCAKAMTVTEILLSPSDAPDGLVFRDLLVAEEGPRRRECSWMPTVEDAERTVASALRAATQPVPPLRPVPTMTCDDCAPSMRAAVIAEREARRARKRPHTTMRSEGTLVITEMVAVEDPGYQRAHDALLAAREKRRALLAPVIDRWREGRVPSPKDFASINGPSYVARLEAALKELRP